MVITMMDLLLHHKMINTIIYYRTVIMKSLHLMKQWTLLKILILTMTAVMTTTRVTFIIKILQVMITSLLLFVTMQMTKR